MNFVTLRPMILIAPDKFKGTFSAPEICALVAERLKSAGITASLKLSPLSDGGEGASDALMPGAIKVAQGVYEREGIRLVVSSELVGFSAFNRSGLPLMQRSSIALGRAIDSRHPTYIAVGGTATSDCGAGFLQGLGAVFYDSANRRIDRNLCPATLHLVARADISALRHYDIKGIIDVRASLCDGPLTALDFAPQKALKGENISGLRDALSHFQSVAGGASEWDGAGGGLGYAIASVCGAPCISGAEAAIDGLNVDWQDVKLVITGEGCVDAQTAKGGKLVDAIYHKASKLGIPVLILYGRVEPPLPYQHLAQLGSRWEDLAKGLLA